VESQDESKSDIPVARRLGASVKGAAEAGLESRGIACEDINQVPGIPREDINGSREVIGSCAVLRRSERHGGDEEAGDQRRTRRR